MSDDLGNSAIIQCGSETLMCPVLQSLWVERTTLTLVQSLPGISRWFEVDKRELVSPTGDHAFVGAGSLF